MFKPCVSVVLLVVVLVGFGIGAAFYVQLQPVGQATRVSVVDVPEGVSFSEVARLLHQRHVIKSERAFTWMGRLLNADRSIIPGEYEFHGGMGPATILSKMTKGEVIQYVVTIPEGFSVNQIADVLEAKQLADREAFLQATEDPAFLRTLSLPHNNLEGYLFPDTYHFTRHMTPEMMIKAMVSRLKQTVSDEYETRAEELGMPMHQVLTLASVIEKETARPHERPLISGVFHNRLRRNIPLQSDPTVIYDLHQFDGDLRKEDLSIESPYNTYVVVGLPPGPIANPGKAAIHAALYPASTDYLYFVSRNDGSHAFSTTLAEHNQAVQKYQGPHRRRSS